MKLRLTNGKTKEFIEILNALSLSGKKLTILVAADNEKVFLAARNIPNIYVVEARSASTYDLSRLRSASI